MIELIKWVFLWSTRHDSFRILSISWGCKNKCMRSRTKLREKWDKLAKSHFWFSSQIWLQSLRAQPQLKLLCCLLQIIAEAKNQPPLCSNNNGWAFSQTHSIMSLLSICFVLKRQSLTSKKKKKFNTLYIFLAQGCNQSSAINWEPFNAASSLFTLTNNLSFTL